MLAERNPDVPAEYVKELTILYCKHLRNTLSSLDYGTVNSPGLGLFYIKPNVLEKEEVKLAGWENARVHHVRERKQLLHQKVQMLQEFFRVEALEKKEKRKLRNEYLDAKQKEQDEQAETPVEE